jgi:hypothetical protein
MDLEELRRGLVQANRDAVPQLAAWIEAPIEKVPRHDVAQCFQHRMLDTGMLAFQVENKPLYTLPLKAQIPACRAAATDYR